MKVNGLHVYEEPFVYEDRLVFFMIESELLIVLKAEYEMVILRLEIVQEFHF